MSRLKGVPRNVNYREMKLDLRRLPGVEAVHSLNVWSLTMDKIVVTVHLAVGLYNTRLITDKNPGCYCHNQK